MEPAGATARALSDSAEEIADAFHSFHDGGYTQPEIMAGPGTMDALETLAPVLELLDADRHSSARANKP
jgi:hypothetical protein